MEIRNIAIIAHVDHGKTSLVDCLLKQSEKFHLKAEAVSEFIMDSNDLERERGITIVSKICSVFYKNYKINIVDTPGHADFSGEVERVINLVDGVLLLVDAKEGPMPQTRFVLKQALQAGHSVIVVINKMDKPDIRPEYTLDKISDLFLELNANERQLNFPVVFASAIKGVAGTQPNLSTMSSIAPIFETIINHIPAPDYSYNLPLSFLVTNLANDQFKGKIGIGRLFSGTLKKRMGVAIINKETKKTGELSSVMVYDGLNRVEVDFVSSGDICAVAGIGNITIGDTITDPEQPTITKNLSVEEPTIKMTFGINTSPLAGKEGKFVTSRQLLERLKKEVETDVALRMETDPSSTDRWIISGRGELHLSILLEKLRREGYELEVSRPEVITKEIDGVECEPFESVFVEVPENFSGTVIELFGRRGGIVADFQNKGATSYLTIDITTRGLIGIRNDLLTATRGQVIMNYSFKGYAFSKSIIKERESDSIVATDPGISTAYALKNAQVRGRLFIGPGEIVYKGMIIGANSKAGDLPVNASKAKELTNFRSKNQGIEEVLEPPAEMTLEKAIEYIASDELVEITPKSIRMRKKILK